MKLSVFLVTYNQEQYIQQALDSIVMQITNFDYEVIIGEDHSDDRTGVICDEYAAKYSNFHVYHHKKNLGLVKNWEFVLNHCKGEYITMLEGDDYWVDPYKLQKQVNFLDSNKDCNLCFTNVDVVDKNGEDTKEQIIPHQLERYYSAAEIYDRWICLTGSVMVRNGFTPIKYNENIYITDTYTFLIAMGNGPAYCLKDVTVAYRRHGENLSMKVSLEHNMRLADQYHYMAKLFPQKELKAISRRKENEYLEGVIWAPYFKGQWKYRFRYMQLHPMLFFTSFFITTVLSYTPLRKLKKKK